MADYPLSGGVESSLAGWVSPYSGTAVATGTASAIGAYSEMLSAANNLRDTVEVEAIVTSVTGSASSFLNVAIGAAGFEEIIIPNVFIGGYTSNKYIKIKFPISIPAGERISCSAQGGTAGLSVYLRLISGGFKSATPFSEVVSLGADTANTLGVRVSNGGVDTFSAWTEIVASTANDYALLSSISFRDLGSWSTSEINYQLAIGAAGFEQIIDDGMWSNMTTAETGGYFTYTHNINIPKGVRLSFRQINSVGGTDLDLDYIFYGVK
tara:strand:+ start:454 stop:1254 length:801 start_codon:yes stop_codon:yes gene_type:complete